MKIDPEIERLIDAHTPRLNPSIANGIAVEHMQQVHVINYIDSAFRDAAKGFPEWLTYEGCRVCTPTEEYFEASRKQGNSRRTIDIARSDLYLVKFFFRFRDEEIVRHMYLPFVGDAGCITLSGSRFFVSPVLADPIISVGTESVFVRLRRDLLTFRRTAHYFVADGKIDQASVAWSMVYHNKQKKMRNVQPTVKMYPTIAHYLFCKYGLVKTFEQFAHCSPVIGGTEISVEDYPPEEFVICSSRQFKPRGFLQGLYEPSHLRIAVKREDYARLVVKNLIGGLFYIADHFPTRVRPEYVNNSTPAWMDNTRTWIILMGHVLFSGHMPEGVLADEINKHLKSLDEYVDSFVLKKFSAIGLPVTDLYQFFAVVVGKISEWIFEGAEHINSMYDKELSVLYFVLQDITKAIMQLYYKVTAVGAKDVTRKDIEDRMRNTITTGLIYRITRMHPEVTPQSSSGDNKALKITGVLVPQSDSSRQGGRKKRATLDDPTKFLHVSIAEVGGYSNLPKSDPTGHHRLNPWLTVDPSGLVLRNPKFVAMLDRIQTEITRSR
jgi:hypothetical protein